MGRVHENSKKGRRDARSLALAVRLLASLAIITSGSRPR
jgi:hypothetical protein